MKVALRLWAKPPAEKEKQSIEEVQLHFLFGTVAPSQDPLPCFAEELRCPLDRILRNQAEWENFPHTWEEHRRVQELKAQPVMEGGGE